MFKVVYKFKDLKDPQAHVYEVGEEYPRAGFKVSAERIKELASNKNKLKKVLIEKQPEEKQEEAPKEEKVEEVKETKKQNKKKKAKD